MTLHTLQDPEGPEQPLPGSASESAVSYALRAIGGLLAESPLAHEQFQAARHDQAEVTLLDAEALRTRKKANDASARVVAERHKASPHKRINRWVGTGLAVTLAVLDVLPAYWSAQAFGLDQGSTLVLTVLLCVALGGAMWLLDLFAAKGRTLALRLVELTLGAGFAALFILRLDYLDVTGAAGFWQAAVQALALTALSAALVAVGYVLLSHRVPREVTAAQHAARQVAGPATAQAAEAAHDAADRSRAALEDTIVAWAVTQQPTGISHEDFLTVIGQAIDILLSR